MPHSARRFVAAIALALGFAMNASAQEPPAYGTPINLEDALKVIEAAKVEAEKQKWPVVIAVVDGSGYLVALHRLDNTQLASIDVAIAKAKCAATFRRATKVFEDTLATGGANLRVLAVPGAIPVEGGIPLLKDGKIIGAIGVSGVKANEDGQVAGAGAAVVK
jgi:glc operon protein GlcG